jgi:hypothetical protein
VTNAVTLLPEIYIDLDPLTTLTYLSLLTIQLSITSLKDTSIHLDRLLT